MLNRIRVLLSFRDLVKQIQLIVQELTDGSVIVVIFSMRLSVYAIIDSMFWKGLLLTFSEVRTTKSRSSSRYILYIMLILSMIRLSEIGCWYFLHISLNGYTRRHWSSGIRSCNFIQTRTRDSSVCLATVYGLDCRDSIPGKGMGFFSFP
jgi:hypothetical protein